MKIWDSIKAAYSRVDSILDCAALYAGSCIFDALTSMHFPAGVEEGNPFARHVDGSFWPRHAAITDGMFALQAVLMSASLYIGTRMLGEKFAKFTAGLPWLWFAWLHLDAGFENLLMKWPGLFVQTQHDLLRALLGY